MTLAVLLGATMLAGCASMPDLGEMPQPKAGVAFASSQTLAAPVADWPSVRWWTAYGDAQLTALIEEGLANSPTMAAAEARVRRADALGKQANAALAPQIGAQGQLSGALVDTGGLLGANGPSGLNTAGFALLSASYDFDLWGRNHAALAAAKGEAEAARADAAQARLTLSTSIATAYAEMAQVYERSDAVGEAVEVRRRTAQLMGERQENGLENRGSVSQATAGLAQAQADQAALEETVELTRNRIAVLLGAGPDRGRTLARPQATAKAFGLPAQLQADLVGRRPDIVAARLRAEAAAARIKQARAGFYPNVDLSAMAGGLLVDLFSGGAPLLFASAGPAISLPIFGGGKVEGQVRQARAEYEIAVADYDRTVAGAFQEVADVAVSERALVTRLERTRAALTASQDAYRVAGERYRGGLSSLLEVLRTEDTLIANQRAVADLETRALLLDIALVRALGGGYGS